MLRKIIKIDRKKCNGCSACAKACHEDAIEMVNGKAELTKENYCDGLGDCLPACPTGAISFEIREAPAYDEAAAIKAKSEKTAASVPFGCPGTKAASLHRTKTESAVTQTKIASELSQWPVQIKLVPVHAPYFNSADLLVAADCTAFAYGNFHKDFIRNRITLIGCPKLDSIDYAEKLTQIIASNDISGITVVRMEVPCCGGLESALKHAVALSEKPIPCRVVTISTDGKIL